jgi:hypothetical protein
MIAQDYATDYVSVDGLRDAKRPEGIRYMGKATRQPDGKYHCLAIVGGTLCVVEVTLTPDPGLLAGFAKLW